MKATKYRTIRPELVGLCIALLLALTASKCAAQGPAITNTPGYTCTAWVSANRDTLCFALSKPANVQAYMVSLNHHESPRRWDAIHMAPAGKLTQVVKVPIEYEAMQPGGYSFALQIQTPKVVCVGTFTLYK